MNEILYRQAGLDDLEALVTLRSSFLAESTGTGPQPALMEALQNYFAQTLRTGEYMGYVAAAEGEIVATSGMVINRIPPRPSNLNGREAYVMNMYTRPGWRGRGIATTLLQRLIALARHEDCSRLSLHALPMGRSIYVKAGLVPVETEMRLDLRPALTG